jgi:hypothetical protein
MRLPKLTNPNRVRGGTARGTQSSAFGNEIEPDTTRDDAQGITPSGECGCKHGCLGPCVLGNCLGTCHGIGI